MVTTPEETRRAWAYGYLSRVRKPGPSYGSPEWLALPEGPEKWASVVRAAEALVIYDELRDLEIDSYRLAGKRAEDAEFQARAELHRQEWGSKSYTPHPVNSRGDAA